MKSDYLVSICVPIYKVENYIERCARSLFGQTYNNVEYIFIDDCSPDKSVQILKSVIDYYPQRKKEAIIIQHEKNRGLAAARNTAVHNAKGDFILCVDSDDYLDLEFVHTAVKLQKETNADIVTMNALHEYKNRQIKWRYPQYESPQNMIESVMVNEPVCNIWGRLIRRSLYVKHNIVCQEGLNVGEDFQQLIPLIYYSKIVVTDISDISYHYNCSNEDSYMYDFSIKNAQSAYESHKIIFKFLKDKDQKMYEDIIQRCMVRIIAGQMVDLFLCKDEHKDYFQFLRSELIKTDKSNWSHLEKAKQIMLLIKNYWLAKQYVRIARFVKYRLINK